jgi:hypothetical protein
MPQGMQGCCYKLKGLKVVVTCIAPKPTTNKQQLWKSVLKAVRAYSRMKCVNQMRFCQFSLTDFGIKKIVFQFATYTKH